MLTKPGVRVRNSENFYSDPIYHAAKIKSSPVTVERIVAGCAIVAVWEDKALLCKRAA